MLSLALALFVGQIDNHAWTEITPARMTQSLVIVNDRHTINPRSRSQTERRWQIPGGLLNAKDWSSTVYKRADTWHWRWVTRFDVLNSFGSYQGGQGWTREYGAGAFKDVLTNTRTGRVFEVRIAERESGKWRRAVEYRDPDHYPAGYVPQKVSQCHACHAKAGSEAIYGGGVIPGGGGVFSEVVHEHLEAGQSRDAGYAPVGG